METQTSFQLLRFLREPISDNTSLQLSPISINEDYRKKWNITFNDFVCLTMNGNLISNTLYRVGGWGVNVKEDYFMLLKHVEAFYEDSITKDKSRKPHLESQWCILNKNGTEKVNFKPFDSPYLAGGIIYSINSKYYNIETGEFYCNSHTSMKTTKFIFLDNKFDDDKLKRGVMKINKEDGTWELFQ